MVRVARRERVKARALLNPSATWAYRHRRYSSIARCSWRSRIEASIACCARSKSSTVSVLNAWGMMTLLSTLVQIVRIAAIDTTAQRVVFRKYFQFRGDNDEAWERAERFVSEAARERLLETRLQQ